VPVDPSATGDLLRAGVTHLSLTPVEEGRE
jgi:hypothetical protein